MVHNAGQVCSVLHFPSRQARDAFFRPMCPYWRQVPTPLLSLPRINPPSGYGVVIQMGWIECSITLAKPVPPDIAYQPTNLRAVLLQAQQEGKKSLIWLDNP